MLSGYCREQSGSLVLKKIDKSSIPIFGVLLFVAKKSFDNSLTFANVKTSQGIKISVGEHSIVLSKNGVTASQNLNVTKNDFNIDSLQNGANLRIEVLGDNISVGIRNDDGLGNLSVMYI